MALTIQSGKVDNFTASINTGWQTVNFPTAFPTTPLVFAQIQTFGGADTPGLRLKNITNSSFDVRMDEIVSHNATSSTLGDLGKIQGSGDHINAETLGWMAIEQD